jgi:hypothetical protein
MIMFFKWFSYPMMEPKERPKPGSEPDAEAEYNEAEEEISSAQ